MMKERGLGGNPNQEFTDREREQRRQQELLDGTNLLPEILKERMPALYSQEHERNPVVVVKYFDPVGSWTWYATEGSPVDEDGYMDTNKEKVDFLFFGLVVGFEPELGYFSLNELNTAKEGLRGIRALPIERDIHFSAQRLSEVKRRHHIS
jgi:Protein of unknown function (DUF2958)